MIPTLQLGQFGLRRISAGGDPLYASVVDLLHMDGANGSTTFTDEKGRAWTANGNAQISTAQSKFGGASGSFDGTGDFVTSAASADFTFGMADFTVENFAWFTNVAGNHGMYCFNGGWSVRRSGTTLTLFTGSSNIITAAAAVTHSTWTHIALVRDAGTFRLFVNGTSVGTSADATNLIGTNFTIGAATNAGATPMNGFLDELRVTKGVARYTANFTPPVAPFPNF